MKKEERSKYDFLKNMTDDIVNAEFIFQDTKVQDFKIALKTQLNVFFMEREIICIFV